jgi:WD40 repeat protein
MFLPHNSNYIVASSLDSKHRLIQNPLSREAALISHGSETIYANSSTAWCREYSQHVNNRFSLQSAVSYTPWGDWLLSGSEDNGKLFIWDLDMQPAPIFTWDSGQDMVHTIAACCSQNIETQEGGGRGRSNNDNHRFHFVTGGRDGTVKFWSIYGEK